MMRQLPLEAVRDLLGIARAMYAARKREGMLDALPELAEIGKKLALARKLGRTDRESVGHKAAWAHAEDATSRLMRLISIETRLAPTLEAAVIRIREAKTEPPVSKSERKTGVGNGSHR
jgi:hypothetical protein